MLYLRADDPDNEALIEELEYAQQFNRCSKRLETLAQRGLAAEQSGAPAKPQLALPARASVPVEAPRRSEEDTETQKEKAANAFLNTFG